MKLIRLLTESDKPVICSKCKNGDGVKVALQRDHHTHYCTNHPQDLFFTPPHLQDEEKRLAFKKDLKESIVEGPGAGVRLSDFDFYHNKLESLSIRGHDTGMDKVDGRVVDATFWVDGEDITDKVDEVLSCDSVVMFPGYTRPTEIRGYEVETPCSVNLKDGEEVEATLCLKFNDEGDEFYQTVIQDQEMDEHDWIDAKRFWQAR